MKTQSFKSALCLLLVLSILLPLGGCGKEKNPTFEDGQYINTAGEVMEPQEVTLDVIAMSNYQKNFDELTESMERRDVVTRYLEYHLTASDETQLAGKNTVIDLVSGFDPNLPPVYEKRLDLADGIISKASAALSAAEVSSKFADDSGFENFVESLNKGFGIVEMAMNFSKACYIVADLVNSDVDNKEEYCNDIIDGLSLITSYVPVFDEYFTKSLEIVKVGLQEVLENYEMHERMYDIYGKEISPVAETIYTANDTYACMANSQLWSNGPSISTLMTRPDLFFMIPAGKPYECFRDYILWRVPFELQGGKSESTESDDGKSTNNPAQPNASPNTENSTKPCSHLWIRDGVIKNPTCAEKGIEQRTCRHCKTTKEVELEMLEHTYEVAVVQPTYEVGGYTLHTCKVCNASYKDNETDPIPRGISGTGNWYGEGRREHSKTGFFKLRVDSVSEGHISGYLDVYTIILGEQKTVHQTTFTGTGQATEDGYVYLLKFDQSVTFGVVPAYTYTEMKLYYKSEKDVFAFEGMYDVVMKRT